MYTLRKIFVHSPGHYVAAAILAAAVFLFRWMNLPEEVGTAFAVYECLSVSGGVTFLVGALFTVTYFGAFELFTYVFAKGGGKKKYKNYAQYANEQEEKRGREAFYFVPYMAVGVVVFLISFLLA